MLCPVHAVQPKNKAALAQSGVAEVQHVNPRLTKAICVPATASPHAEPA